MRCIGLDKTTELDHKAKHQEMHARDSAAEQYQEGFTPLKDALEMSPSIAAMNPTRADRVVELGCGTGWHTMSYLPHVERAVAIDFSVKSLAVLQQKAIRAGLTNLLLVQADITSLPLAQGFTKCVSFQVIEHLPTALQRQQVIDSITKLLQPGGMFISTVYHWSLRKRREAALGSGDNTAKEGYHNTGIYYYNFDENEYREMLDRVGLRVISARGLKVSLPGGRVLGRLIVPITRIIGKMGWGVRRADLLLVTARRP